MRTTLLFCFATWNLAWAQNPAPGPLTTAAISTSGVFPSLTVTAESAPARSECGVGAMMAWADRLYVVSYLSVPNAGNGTGLYSIDQNLAMETLANHSSVYANRLLHPASNSIIIGPYVIDAMRNVRTFESLLSVRVGGMAEHILFPDTMVYMLGMDGPLWECDVYSLACTQLFDLVEALGICAACGEQPHFKVSAFA